MTDEEREIWWAAKKEERRLEKLALINAIRAQAIAARWIEQIEENMPPSATLVVPMKRLGNPKHVSDTWKWGVYTCLDTRLAGKWWVPNSDWKCQRYLCSWPFGKPIEWRDDFSAAELVQHINGIDSYHCAENSLLELCQFLFGPTGSKLGFHYHSHSPRWEWTVL